MALMIPSECSNNTLSKAEIDLYYTLKSSLNSDWIVFHSYHLVARNLNNKIIDSEIDFLLFHPKYGLLILEVKGGQIKFQRGKWYQNSNMMKLGPDQQARLNKFNVIEYLTKYFNAVPPISIGHAVCFPDYFGDLDKLPGNIQDILISGNHLPHLLDSIVSIMSQYQSNTKYRIDDAMINTFRKALSPIFDFGTSLKDIFGQEERRIFELTEKQIELLCFIDEYKRALIKGCAGSGKTIMAVRKTKELVSEGNIVLVLCYNKMLSKMLTTELKELGKNIVVSTYHDFCISELEKAGYNLINDSEDFWTVEVPDKFLQLMEKNPLKFDAVIVDEGQDFREEYWISINDLVKEDGYYYIFYDPDQNLFDTKIKLPQLSTPFVLSQNCRTTQNIFNTLKPFSELNIRISDKAPIGSEVIEYYNVNSKFRRKYLSQLLHELIIEKKLKENQIVIIGGHSLRNTCIGDDNKIGQFNILENGSPAEKIIPYYTYMKYKGLESDVVILLDVDNHDPRWSKKSSLYTAMSRAKHILYLIYSNANNKVEK